MSEPNHDEIVHVMEMVQGRGSLKPQAIIIDETELVDPLPDGYEVLPTHEPGVVIVIRKEKKPYKVTRGTR